MYPPVGYIWRFNSAMVVALLTVIGLPSCLLAEGQSFLRSGQYEVVVQLDLPHLRGQGAASVAKICVEERLLGKAFGLVVLSKNNPLRFCPPSNVQIIDGALSFDIKCAGKNMAIAHAKYQLMQERFRGRINMKMGGKNMTMQEVQTGRRIGDCVRRDVPPS